MSLHIYSQPYNHDVAFIIGDIDSLKILRGIIDRAIDNDFTMKNEETLYTNDGEGFHCLVMNKDDMNNIKLPYTDMIEMGLDDQRSSPWDLFDWKQYREEMKKDDN